MTKGAEDYPGNGRIVGERLGRLEEGQKWVKKSLERGEKEFTKIDGKLERVNNTIPKLEEAVGSIKTSMATLVRVLPSESRCQENEKKIDANKIGVKWMRWMVGVCLVAFLLALFKLFGVFAAIGVSSP